MQGQTLQPIYGVFDINTRYFDEDDGCGSSNSAEILDSDTDIDVLRARFNAYFAQPRIINFYRNNHYAIADGAMESNSGSGSGGGCVGTHRFVIRQLPRLDVPGYEAAATTSQSEHQSLCKLCGKQMDVPNDRASTNCGGDCLECMAQAGDPDAAAAMEQLQREAKMPVKADENTELRKLLAQAKRLCLTFERGSCYISRNFIDEQADLVQRINAALTPAQET